MSKQAKLTAEEICTLFTETALKATKCMEFDIPYWIKEYDQLRKEPRFAEVALLILSAAQIYGRKVDYIEEFILNVIKSFKGKDPSDADQSIADALAAAVTAENRPRRRAKRMRPEMLSEKLCRADYVPKPFKVMSSTKLSEKVTIQPIDDNEKPKPRSLKQDILKWKLNFPDETGKTKPRPQHRLKIEEEELYSRYTNFGKSYLYDYEDDDVLGIKKDFKVFAGHIEPNNNALLSDLNMKKFYRAQEMLNADPFDDESMNMECSMLEEHRGGSPCQQLFDDADHGNGEDSAVEVDASKESIDTPNTTLNSSLEATKATDTSVDEGIDVSATLSASASLFVMPAMASKVVQKPQEQEIKLNFLKLPEAMLRKKSLFQLPKEMRAKKGPENVGEAVPMAELEDLHETGIVTVRAKRAKPDFLNLTDAALLAIPTPPPSPTHPDDEEEFFGFDAADLLSSTMTNDAYSGTDSMIKSRTMSRDSGFLSPPASVRFSCDDAMNSFDMDSGIGTSYIDDDGRSRIALSQVTEAAIEEEDEDAVAAAVARQLTPEPEAQPELSDRHKELQGLAEQRHLERVAANKDVTMQVNQWHSYLKPILKEAHGRGNFDIHELGTEILNGFQRKGEIRTFEDVVRHKAQPDICRYFLSTLLLANTENIRLEVAANGPWNAVTELKAIQMEFLTADRHYKEMEEMYDAQGAINTKVRKRMHQDEAGDAQMEAVNTQKTPKRMKLTKKALLMSPPTDSGYLSGFDDSIGPEQQRQEAVKRAHDGSTKKVVRKMILVK